jgi:hypothetical protein
LCLCHLPVDSAEDEAIYREVMLGFCARHGVACKPLEDARMAARDWNASTVPAELGARAAALHAALDDAHWVRLDEESRYALFKLSDPKRGPDKLAAALIELGLLAGEPVALSPDVAVCDVTRPPG